LQLLLLLKKGRNLLLLLLDNRRCRAKIDVLIIARVFLRFVYVLLVLWSVFQTL
jgi:hypothetical protein